MRYLHALLTLVALLSACAPGGAPLTTSAPTESATNTSIPPTAIPPSPTPTPPPITAETVVKVSEVLSFSSQGEAIRSLAFSPDGSTLASAGGNTNDFNIRLWDADNGQLLYTLPGHTGIVWMVAFAPDGALLASSSNDGTVKVWDWRNGTLMRTLDFNHEMVSVGFSPDGRTLAAGGVDGWPNAAIWTYSVGDWQPVLKLSEYWDIPDLAYTPDGQLLVGGGTSRNVGVWRASDGEKLFTLFHSGQVSSLDISPDGSTLATGLCAAADANLTCTRGAVWLWNLQAGELSKTLSDFPDWVESVAFSPDGSLLFAGSRDGTLRAYATTDFSVLREFSAAGGLLAISPDGKWLATLEEDETIHLWKMKAIR